jgi:hypothetical protein
MGVAFLLATSCHSWQQCNATDDHKQKEKNPTL